MSISIWASLRRPFTPQLIIAIGRSAERIEVVEIAEGENQRYYRNNGTHFVPKIKVEDLIIG